MKMCFIDDEVSRWTLDVLIAIREYAKKSRGITVECELLAVAVDWTEQDKRTCDFFENIYKEEGIPLKRCEVESDLQNTVKEKFKQGVYFMIDLNLRKDEETALDTQQDYKCLSMKVMDWIAGERYHLYSGYVEETFMTKWCNRFRMLYMVDEPDVIERENLEPGSFSEGCANRLLEDCLA